MHRQPRRNPHEISLAAIHRAVLLPHPHHMLLLQKAFIVLPACIDEPVACSNRQTPIDIAYLCYITCKRINNLGLMKVLSPMIAAHVVFFVNSGCLRHHLEDRVVSKLHT